MLPVPSNFYVRWWLKAEPAGFREENAPPERLLQAVWQHQRLKRAALRLADGRRVRILHPGFGNREAGPDFRDAVIQIEADTPVAGDIEIDVGCDGWHAHGHDINPAFAKVVLHVVWEHRPQLVRAKCPCLALQGALDSPVEELRVWLQSDGRVDFPESLEGQCCPPLREFKAEETVALFHEAGVARLQIKAAQLAARARDAGWDQALWEGLFRALGYKHNSWPMQGVAESRERLAQRCRTALQWQAGLLGVGGLMPGELTRTRSATDQYLKRTWDFWWRERDVFADCALPRQAWRFNGLRPANHPQRRLALAAHWLADNRLVTRIEKWFQAELPAAKRAAALLEVLQGEEDEFWSWHWTLASARLPKAHPLLGAGRVTDLAINVLLPWFWARAVEGRNDAQRRRVESWHLDWPAGEDNAILKLARKRLLGGASARLFDTAAAQQGLLQITKDHCAQSNALCVGCRFPELVRLWRSSRLNPAG